MVSGFILNGELLKETGYIITLYLVFISQGNSSDDSPVFKIYIFFYWKHSSKFSVHGVVLYFLFLTSCQEPLVCTVW